MAQPVNDKIKSTGIYFRNNAYLLNALSDNTLSFSVMSSLDIF